MSRTVLTVYERRLVSRWVQGGVIVAVLMSAGVWAVASGQNCKRVGSLSEQLEDHGYPCQTLEQIEVALGTGDYNARRFAVLLLAERYAERSIPRIKDALGDEHLIVRMAAAGALRKLGDQSGLEPMRADWERLARAGGGEGEATLFQKANIALLGDLMDVSLVLAEFGDNRGYRLAERTALNSAFEGHRYDAIWVLTEIARTSREQLAQQGLNPGAVLEKVAASEKSEVVQDQLFGAMTRFSKELDPALVEGVLGTLASSPHVSEAKQKWARELQKDFEQR